MKRNIYFLLFVIYFAVIANAHPNDTIYTEDAALEVFDNDPERALVIIDSALIVGNIDGDVADFLRAKVYSQSLVNPQLDKAQQILEALMEKDYVKNDNNNKEAVLDLLINIARRHCDNEQWLRWSTDKVKLCQENGDETEALRTEAEIGMILAQQGEVEKGLAKLNGVIGALDEQRHFNEMDACVIAMKRKINVLEQNERYGDIIAIAQNIIKKIDDYREHYDEYLDDSYRMPADDVQREKYCDFYIAQAYGFLSRAYAELGLKNSAKCYMELFEESDYSKTFTGRMMISPAWCKLGQFDKMLAVYNEAAERLGSDTINVNYATMLYGWAMAADAAGNNSVASNYWQRYANMQNLLDKKQREGQAYHYAVRYHLQEERMKSESEQAKAYNNMIMAIAGFILVFVALIFIVWLLIQRKIIKRKNYALTQQISESIKYKKISEMVVSNNAEPQTTTQKLDVESLDNKQLFDYLSDVIRREKLYLDANFGRQVLMDRFKVNERRIGAAFSHSESLPDFVRDLRLEYACQLLTDYPEMSIVDVAVGSGFSTSTVFGRDFKRKFEVTPTYYRSQMTKK